MTGWQAATVFTLGVSTTVAVAAIGAAAAVWFSDQAFVFALTQTGIDRTDTLARVILCVAIAGVGIGASYYLIEFQQWVASRRADRAIRKLRAEAEAIEKERGSEAASEWLADRLPALLGRETNLFGERDVVQSLSEHQPTSGKAL